MTQWLQVFKFPSVERTTYDRCESTVEQTQQEIIIKNPMVSVPMLKKANFLAAQEKENLPEQDTVTVFTPEEIEKFKAEAFRCWGNGKRIYQQAAAYILMLNTGLRTGELLGLLNSDIDLKNRVLYVERGVKEIAKRDGVEAKPGREVKIGKPKSATSKRAVPLNDTAAAMVEDCAGNGISARIRSHLPARSALQRSPPETSAPS